MVWFSSITFCGLLVDGEWGFNEDDDDLAYSNPQNLHSLYFIYHIRIFKKAGDLVKENGSNILRKKKESEVRYLLAISKSVKFCGCSFPLEEMQSSIDKWWLMTHLWSHMPLGMFARS